MSKILVSFGDSWPWGAELDSLASPGLFAELSADSQEKLSEIIGSVPLVTSEDHDSLADLIRTKFAYPYVVAEHLKCDWVLDMSGKGTSLNHLFLELCKFKKIHDRDPKNQYIFLVSLTTMYRDLYFDQATGEPREIMPYADTAWYYRHIDVEHAGVVNWVRSVSLFQLFCKQHQILDFYFQEFTELSDFQLRMEDYQAMIDWGRVYNQGLGSFMTHFQECAGQPGTNHRKFDAEEIRHYFHPCVNHPNITGHKEISRCVLDFIKLLNPELFPT